MGSGGIGRFTGREIIDETGFGCLAGDAVWLDSSPKYIFPRKSSVPKCRVSRCPAVFSLTSRSIVKLLFCGANRQVTESRYFLQTSKSTVGIDCGLFQERAYEARNWNPSLIIETKIDSLILTHAHIDHCGLVPRLMREGFNAPIISTRPTSHLLGIMLKDAAKIQEEDAKYKEKRHKKTKHYSRFPVEPLYETGDAEQALELRKGVAYGQPYEVTEDVSRCGPYPWLGDAIIGCQRRGNASQDRVFWRHRTMG